MRVFKSQTQKIEQNRNEHQVDGEKNENKIIMRCTKCVRPILCFEWRGQKNELYYSY